MPAQRITVPDARQPLLVSGRQIDPVWFRWAASISDRRAGAIADLSGAKTNDELRDAINALQQALRDADLMETS